MGSPRVHYLDWLRLLAVLAVVVFHALLPFASLAPWHIKNVEQSDGLGFLVALLPFAFPVFFLLAGASAQHALRTRTIRAFLVERTARVLVPFLVGAIVLVPPTGYVVALQNGSAPDSFLAYLAGLPRLIEDTVQAIGFGPVLFPVLTMHLWFLAWLYLFCLLAWPVFAFLSTSRGLSVVDRLAQSARRPGATLLFAVPVVLIGLPLFGVSSPLGWDWAAFGMWGTTFVGGYLLFSDERLVAAARRDLPLALAAAALGVVGLSASGFTTSIIRGGAHTYDAPYVLVASSQGLSIWGVTLTVIGAAMRVGFMQRPLPARANELALPTYLLHFLLVITITALVVQLPLALWPKALLNVALGLAATLLVVTGVVRIAVVRPLIGLRARPSTEVLTRPPPATLRLGRRART